MSTFILNKRLDEFGKINTEFENSYKKANLYTGIMTKKDELKDLAKKNIKQAIIDEESSGSVDSDTEKVIRRGREIYESSVGVPQTLIHAYNQKAYEQAIIREISNINESEFVKATQNGFQKNFNINYEAEIRLGGCKYQTETKFKPKEFHDKESGDYVKIIHYSLQTPNEFIGLQSGNYKLDPLSQRQQIKEICKSIQAEADFNRVQDKNSNILNKFGTRNSAYSSFHNYDKIMMLNKKLDASDKVSFKKPAKAFTELCTFELRQTDVYRGYRLAKNVFKGTKAVYKYGFRPVANLAFNRTVKVAQHFGKLTNVELVQVKNFTRSTRIFDELRSIKNTRIYTRKSLRFERTFGKYTNNIQGKALKNFYNDKLSLKLQYKNKTIDKATYKNIRKQNLGKLGQSLQKSTNKGVQKLGKGFEKLSKFQNPKTWLKNKIKAKIKEKILEKAFFKKITEFVSKFLAKFTQILSAIGTAIGYIVFIIVTIILIIYLIYCIAYILDLMFSTSDLEIYSEESTKIYSYFKDEHDDFVENIEQEANSIIRADLNGETDIIDGNVIDFVYVNGQRENFKEVYSAINTMVQNDLVAISDSNYTQKDNSDVYEELVKEYYEASHNYSFVPYTFQYDDGTFGTAYHCYITVLHDETLCYEMFSLASQEKTGTYQTVEDIVDLKSTSKIAYALKTALSHVQSYENRPNSDGSLTAHDVEFATVNINGTERKISLTETGFIKAVLSINGILSSDYSECTNYALTQRHDFNNCSRFAFSGYEHLKEGDILLGRNGCAVYLCTLSGTPYVFSFSDEAKDTCGVIAENYSHDYVYVLRPFTQTENNSLLDERFYAEDLDEDDEYENLKSLSEWFQTNILDTVFFPNYSNEELIMDSDIENEDFSLEMLGQELRASISSEIFTADNYNYNSLKKVDESEAEAYMEEYKDYDLEIGDAYGNNNLYTDINEAFEEKGYVKVSSEDYVRYFYSHHGISIPFNDDEFLIQGTRVCTGKNLPKDKTIDDVLQIGDVLWYIGYTGKTDTTTYSADNYDGLFSQLGLTDFTIWDVTSAETTTTGVNTIDGYVDCTYHVGAHLLSTATPLIYIGNGEFIAYSYDVTRPVYAMHDEGQDYYKENAPAVRIYKISELDFNRIWQVNRYVGFTAFSVYGSNDFFSGWTDENIYAYKRMLNDDRFETNSLTEITFNFDFTDETVTVAKSSAEAEEELLTIDNNQAFITAKGFDVATYDLFTKDIETYADYEHFDTLKALNTTFVKDYEETGILPTTNFYLALAISNYYSSEESLIYKNIYGILDLTNSKDGVDVRKFEYNNDTKETTATIKHYKKYDTLYDCYLDFVDKVLNKASTHSGFKTVLSSTRTTVNENTVFDSNLRTYANQTVGFASIGLITETTADRANQIYDKSIMGYETTLTSTQHDQFGIDEYDEYAKTRVDKMENIEFITEHKSTLKNKEAVDKTYYDKEYSILKEYKNSYDTLTRADYLEFSTDRSDSAINLYKANAYGYACKLKEYYDYNEEKYEALKAELQAQVNAEYDARESDIRSNYRVNVKDEATQKQAQKNTNLMNQELSRLNGERLGALSKADEEARNTYPKYESINPDDYRG